ncbi:MAG: phytanoyl-CoA dioxygenase family protein [Acidimicrobiales bacterium]
MPPTLHPLNESFDWVGPTGRCRLLGAAELERWNADGYFVLEDALDRRSVEDLAAAIDPFEDEMSQLLRSQPGGRIFIADAEAITFTTHLVTKSPVARRFAAQRLLAELAGDLLGADVRLYWDQAVYKKPESAKEFPWHQDNGYNFVEPQQYLTCWIPLVDVTTANGCPWVVPGLHRLGTLEHWWTDTGWQCLAEAPEAVPVETRAGSVVVFSSLTPHRTGPNLTSGVRKAYIVQFAPDGAESVRVVPDGERLRMPQDAPDRQFSVVRGGEVLPQP